MDKTLIADAVREVLREMLGAENAAPPDENSTSNDPAGCRPGYRPRAPDVDLAEVAHVISDSGRIVLISSTAGQRGEAFHADYAATKGAVISITKSLAIELAPRDITVNCVAPGWVDTEMVAGAISGQGIDRISRGIPLGRIATPDDIAGPVVFLCSALARHVTGEIVNVNGGSVLCG